MDVKLISNFFSKISTYARLMRINRPIGIYLLLWPTLIALWIAAKGKPEPKIVFVFVLGVILMRSAGCIINDLVDKDFDRFVSRTKNRPLANGTLQSWEAFIPLSLLLFISAMLVFTLNRLTWFMSVGALFLAILYPFMKRYTYLPQVFLGAAFGFAIPMAFTAITNSISWQAFVLYGATILWSVAYDTQYAMADRVDDLNIGLKSTAILFGKNDRLIICLLEIVFLSVLIFLGYSFKFGGVYFIGPLGGFIFVAYQYRLTGNREPENCLKAFRNNHFLGLFLFIFLWLDYRFPSIVG